MSFGYEPDDPYGKGQPPSPQISETARALSEGSQKLLDELDIAYEEGRPLAIAKKRLALKSHILDLEVGRIEYLEAALRKIAEGRGRFSRDHLTHASNTIDDMKEIANRALVGTWEAPEDSDVG